MTETFDQRDALFAHHPKERVEEIAEAALHDIEATSRKLRKAGINRQTVHNLMTGVVTAWRSNVDHETIMQAADRGFVGAEPES